MSRAKRLVRAKVRATSKRETVGPRATRAGDSCSAHALRELSTSLEVPRKGAPMTPVGRRDARSRGALVGSIDCQKRREQVAETSAMRRGHPVRSEGPQRITSRRCNGLVVPSWTAESIANPGAKNESGVRATARIPRTGRGPHSRRGPIQTGNQNREPSCIRSKLGRMTRADRASFRRAESNARRDQCRNEAVGRKVRGFGIAFGVSGIDNNTGAVGIYRLLIARRSILSGASGLKNRERWTSTDGALRVECAGNPRTP